MDWPGKGDTTTTYALLHRRAKAEVERSGLSLVELAQVSEINEDRLRGILEGQAREVTLHELAALAGAMGVTVIALLSP